MRRFLRFNSAQDIGIPVRRMSEITTQLTREITSRYRGRRQDAGTRASLLVSKFVDRVLDKVCIERALRSPAALGLLPDRLRGSFRPPMVAWYYPRTLGSLWFNYRPLVTKKTVGDLVQLAAAPCRCGRLPQRFLQCGGHVATCDMSIVQSLWLRCLLEKGTRHRVVSADWLKEGSGIGACIEEFKKGIDAWVDDFGKSSEDWVSDDVRGYAERVFEDVGRELGRVRVGGRELGLDDLLDDAAGRELKALRRLFVVAYVDKIPTKFVFVCKKFYASLLLQE